jgi:hypothetical protein
MVVKCNLFRIAPLVILFIYSQHPDCRVKIQIVDLLNVGYNVLTVQLRLTPLAKNPAAPGGPPPPPPPGRGREEGEQG